MKKWNDLNWLRMTKNNLKWPFLTLNDLIDLKRVSRNNTSHVDSLTTKMKLWFGKNAFPSPSFSRNSDIILHCFSPQSKPIRFLSGLQLSSFQQHKWISLTLYYHTVIVMLPLSILFLLLYVGFLAYLQSIWKDNW